MLKHSPIPASFIRTMQLSRWNQTQRYSSHCGAKETRGSLIRQGCGLGHKGSCLIIARIASVAAQADCPFLFVFLQSELRLLKTFQRTAYHCLCLMRCVSHILALLASKLPDSSLIYRFQHCSGHAMRRHKPAKGKSNCIAGVYETAATCSQPELM